MLGDLIRNAALSKGYFVSKASNDSEVRDFVHKLKPHETNKKLIRLGGPSDGGYLIPDDLEGIEYCFSPGVARTAGFESDLAQRGIRSFLADYSVDRPPVDSEMFHFEKKFLGAVNSDVFMTLEAWIAKSLPGHTHDLLLQMDIEGSECDVMMQTPENVWRQFRILVIEFHSLHTVFNRYGLKLFDFCFRKILNHFEVVHLHPNNVAAPVRKGGLAVPGVMEMTFLRKDRIRSRKRCTVFPHSLDRPNCPGIRDVVLPDCWYR